ncbi:prolipoprotein diacylglyceryl transferase [Patescibacteria group bacterium]|nr:prolipoprotein diacylglyceryl transferase [Patescibacteria group bacterium]
MYPVLFSIGKFSVSSYGVFLALGFVSAIFLVWRLSRAWDLNEEKTLDLTLFTILGGILGARIIFVIENLNYFLMAPLNIILIHKIPGFSFWGGILGGSVMLYFLTKRSRMDFWQVADIASVGLFAGLIFSNLGCFAGGCNVGIPLKAFFAVPMVGALGKRWPIQIIEASVLTFGLLKIWSAAIHFHQRGKIVSLTLIYIGILKLLLDPLKQDHSERGLWSSMIILGLVIYYRITRQNPILHLKTLGKYLVMLITDQNTRKEAVQTFSKTCYNQKANFFWQVRNLKKALRRLNVKFSRKNS